MTKEQFFAKRIHWPKIAMFIIAIVLPSIAIGISNQKVFPTALFIATIGLIVTVGVSAISTYFSGNAAPATRKYALWHDFAIAAILCITYLIHFQIAREVSAANDARAASKEAAALHETNLDRDVQRQKELALIEQDKARAETERLREQRRVLLQLQPNQRGRVISNTATPAPTVAQSFSSAVAPTPKAAAAPIPTPEEVLAFWFPYLFGVTAAEILFAVLGGMILMMVWQWDVDGDGIDDRLQRRISPAMSPSIGTVAAKTQHHPSSHNFYDPK